MKKKAALAVLGGIRMFRRRMRGYAVLTYHALNTGKACRQKDSSSACTVEDDFLAQMKYVSGQCHCIGIDELVQRVRAGVKPDGLYVSVTFDDGYASCRTIASPILEAVRIPAAFFITAGFIGSRIPDDAAARGYMQWDDVRALAKVPNFVIGAHSMTHGRFSDTEDYSRRELVDAKQEIERQVNSPVRYYAYPYGTAVEMAKPSIRDRCRQAGYAAAFSNQDGYNHAASDLYALKRIAVRPNEPLAVFITRLTTADIVGAFNNGTRKSRK